MNRDTWLVTLWINNGEEAYRYFMKRKAAWIGILKTGTINNLHLDMFKARLKAQDEINWSKVDWFEVRSELMHLGD